MTLKLAIYALYLGLSVALTVWVARTLHKNGRRFLVDVFHGDDELADSVNHLLVVGFYLINIGFVALALRVGIVVEEAAHAVEILAQKMGWVMLVLGGMHFFNLYVFNRLRRRSLAEGGGPRFDDGHRGAGGLSSTAAVTARLASERLRVPVADGFQPSEA